MAIVSKITVGGIWFMELDASPISSPVACPSGSFATVPGGDVYHYDSGSGWVSVKGSAFGWQEFSDQGIVLPTIADLGGGEVLLTCDSGGSPTSGLTNTSPGSTYPGVTDIWNSTKNCFNFSEAGLVGNDFLVIRFDFFVTPNIVPLRSELRLKFYDLPDASSGVGSEIFTLTRSLDDIDASAGVPKARLPEIGFYVGPLISGGSMEVEFSSTAGCTVQVNGWNIRIHRPEASLT